MHFDFWSLQHDVIELSEMFLDHILCALSHKYCFSADILVTKDWTSKTVWETDPWSLVDFDRTGKHLCCHYWGSDYLLE